jgi:hypothetical protein
VAYSVVASVAANGNSGGSLTGAVDTTGANLIIVAVSFSTSGAAPTLSDNKGNTWTGLTAQANVSEATVRLYYSYNPTVGTGHTLTIAGATSFSTLSVLAVSGAASSPFDQENGATSGSSAIATGSVTPGEDNELLAAAAAYAGNGTATVDGGFTVSAQADYSAGNSYGCVLTYLIQTSAAAANPTITCPSSGGSTNTAAAIATFRADGGAAVTPLRTLLGVGV